MTEMNMGKGPGPTRAPSRGLVALILAALFLTGLLAGVALDRMVLHHQHGPFAGMGPGPRGLHEPPEHRAEMQKRLADRITSELDLSPDQRVKLEAMLPAHAAAFDSLRTEMDARLRTLLDSSSADVERILTPAQQTQWAEIRRQFEDRGAPPRP
jgi:Spy/CpxP family protein refolding chaperone